VWKAFFEAFDLLTTFERQPRDELDGPLQIVLEPHPSLDIEYVERYPVIPRVETIEYMHENYAQFQSVLAMLDGLYNDLDLGVTYRETNTVMSFTTEVTCSSNYLRNSPKKGTSTLFSSTGEGVLRGCIPRVRQRHYDRCDRRQPIH